MDLRSIAVKAGRRSKYLILSPESEWQKIVSEKTGKGTAFLSFALPWCFVITLAAGVGSILFESRMIFSWGYLFLYIVSVFVNWMFALFGSSWMINEIAPQFGIRKQPGKFFVMYSYSLTPAFFAMTVVSLFPALELVQMLGFYSIFLMQKGSRLLFSDLKEEVRISLIAVATGLFILFYTLSHLIFHSMAMAMVTPQ